MKVQAQDANVVSSDSFINKLYTESKNLGSSLLFGKTSIILGATASLAFLVAMNSEKPLSLSLSSNFSWDNLNIEDLTQNLLIGSITLSTFLVLSKVSSSVNKLIKGSNSSNKIDMSPQKKQTEPLKKNILPKRNIKKR